MGHGASFRLPYGTGREFRRENREMECSHVVSTKDSLIAPVHERMPNVSPSPALPPLFLSSFLSFSCRRSCPSQDGFGSHWAFLKRTHSLLHEFKGHPLRLLYSSNLHCNPTVHDEWLSGLRGPPEGAVGGCLVRNALSDPAHQASGVHARRNRDYHRTWHQASPGAHHRGPHLSRSRQLRGHWHVCGVWAGGQGNGRTWRDCVLHHCCCCVHTIR